MKLSVITVTLSASFISAILTVNIVWLASGAEGMCCFCTGGDRGQVIKAGKEFISPTADCTLADLITHRQLIDSNGFSHRRMDAPAWNPDLKIYVDYDLLCCASQWGREGFVLNPQVLVEYTQTNEGIIGRSSYQDWGHRTDSKSYISQTVPNIANSSCGQVQKCLLLYKHRGR